MNDIAQLVGYGVMACAGIYVVAVVLFAISYACVQSVNLNTLRKTMRQLEAEGKVRKKEIQQ